jgi:hypothetical protein
MSTGGLLAGIFIFLVAVLWIGSPLLRHRASAKNEEVRRQKQHDRLLMIYERVLNNIRDLDEDYTTGKMQPLDYETERENWVQNGIQVLKAIDSLDVRPMAPTAGRYDDSDIDRQIEEAIAAHRAKTRQTT